MIDRREFVQSMIALGRRRRCGPPRLLFAAPNQELKGLADAALATAKQAGASYADIRINRYRNQFLFTRDRRVQNIVNTEDFGFGVRVLVDGHVGLRQQQRRHEGRRRRDRAAGGRDRQGEQDRQHRSGPAGAGRGLSRRRVEHAGEEGSVRDAAAAEDRSAAADQRGGAEGQGRELRVGVHAVREREEVLRLDRRLLHHPVADPLVPELLGDVGRPRDQPLLPAQRADRRRWAMGYEYIESLPLVDEAQQARRGSGRDAQGQARRAGAEDADPAPLEPLADDPRVGRPPDRAGSRARLRGELRRHQLPHHRQAREVPVRLADGATSSATRRRTRRWRPAATTTTA